MINKNKAQIENLKETNSKQAQQIADLTKKQQSLEHSFNQVLQTNTDLLVENKNLQNSLNSQIPFTNLSLDGVPYIDSNQINANMSIRVKQQMGGMLDVVSTSSNGSTNNSPASDVWITYLLILERAKYFMSCCQFEGTVEPLVELLYQGLYYGALNGSIALTIDDKGAYLFYPSECIYDKYGNLLNVNGTTFNYLNSANFKEEEVHLNGKKVAIFKFNNEEFGLWVLAWYYLNNVPRMLNWILNQGALYNKKFILTADKKNSAMRSELATMLRSPSILIYKSPDTDLAPLETPDIDINALWGYLDNYTNWWDFHTLNMRVKDVNDSQKERDIASQQTNHATQVDNKNQFVDYFIDKWVHEINNKFGTDIKWHNRMINLDDGIINQSKTINKLEGGDKE